MKLYFSPGACSLADHIAIHEAGLDAEFVKVDLKAKTTESGEDFTRINPKGYVPALVLDSGETLTENIAVLGYIAETAGKLMPAQGLAHWRVIETTAFISTELHKNYKPFFNQKASEAEKDEARAMLGKRFALVEDMLGDRDFIVGDAISIADCYLFVTLFWAKEKVKLDVPERLSAYYERLKARPAVQEAMRMEGLA